MSEPDGPTGVITLKQISDLAYEQYGTILMNATGSTQIFITAQDFSDLFERQTLETQIVWLGEFQSRIQGTRNPNQSSFYNVQQMCWPGGAWAIRDNQITSEATLSGGVAFSVDPSVNQYAYFATNESQGIFNSISHVSYNPTFFMRWAQAGASGNTSAIGWIRNGNGFVSNNTQGSINFRWVHDGEIIAVCAEIDGFSTLETTLGTGVTAVTGVYHAGRAVVSGGGTAVEFFLDGVSVGTITTNIPTEGAPAMLVPNFGQYSNNGVASMIVDYMALSQQRTP